MGLHKYKATKDYVHHVGGYTSSEVDMESSEGKMSTRVDDVRTKTLAIVFENATSQQSPNYDRDDHGDFNATF